MKATAKLLVAALAAAGALASLTVQAQHNPVARGAQPAAIARSGGGHSGGVDHGGRGFDRGGHWDGHRWGGYRHAWAPGWSFYFGVPVFWGSWYWGAPYWYDYYPGSTVIYREVEREASYPDHRIGPATTEVPRGEGLPSQGPLYMNYCESAKAYFPKVTTCPEGWKLATPTQ
jgi:hypothetical protein